MIYDFKFMIAFHKIGCKGTTKIAHMQVFAHFFCKNIVLYVIIKQL